MNVRAVAAGVVAVRAVAVRAVAVAVRAVALTVIKAKYPLILCLPLYQICRWSQRTVVEIEILPRELCGFVQPMSG